MDRNGDAEVDNGIVDPPGSQDMVFEIDVRQINRKQRKQKPSTVMISLSNLPEVKMSLSSNQPEVRERVSNQTSRFLRHFYL
jgi:hypothetical protein